MLFNVYLIHHNNFFKKSFSLKLWSPQITSLFLVTAFICLSFYQTINCLGVQPDFIHLRVHSRCSSFIDWKDKCRQREILNGKEISMKQEKKVTSLPLYTGQRMVSKNQLQISSQCNLKCLLLINGFIQTQGSFNMYFIKNLRDSELGSVIKFFLLLGSWLCNCINDSLI